MIPIKRLGRMRINNRKNLEYCSLFECPRCGSHVIRPTGEGNRLTAHVNENKLDNRPENIELMSSSEHSRLHAKEKWEERGGFVAI